MESIVDNLASAGIITVISIIVLALIVIWVSWILGKLLGKHVPQMIGLIFGIGLIILGVSLFAGISCIVYSSKNKDESLNWNFNSSVNSSRKTNIQETTTKANDSTRECPYCAEKIKKEAIVCRFCSRSIEPVV